MYLLGSDGKYLEDNNADEAMSFSDIIDADGYRASRRRVWISPR